jgi:hypothetical protein
VPPARPRRSSRRRRRRGEPTRLRDRSRPYTGGCDAGAHLRS